MTFETYLLEDNGICLLTLPFLCSLFSRKTSIYARHTTGNDKLGRYIQLTEEEFKERVPVLTEIVEEGMSLLPYLLHIYVH